MVLQLGINLWSEHKTPFTTMVTVDPSEACLGLERRLDSNMQASIHNMNQAIKLLWKNEVQEHDS
jgi:hypothetical protein